MEKFRTEGIAWSKIKPVEIESETTNFVIINGRRSAKMSSYHCFFDTWQEAHDYLMLEAENALNTARRRLEEAQGKHGNIKGMKPPAP